MDPISFDRLSRALATPCTRHQLLTLLSAVPLAGGLATLLDAETEAKDRRKRRKQRNTRHAGDDKRNRKGKRKGQDKDQDKGQDKGKDSCAKAGQALKKGTPCCTGLSEDATGHCVATKAPPPPPGCVPDPVATTCGSQVCGTALNNCGVEVDCSVLCAGCCDGVTCQLGTDDDACGAGGADCDPCDGEEMCRAEGPGGTCRLNQAPDAFNLTYNDDWGKACIVVTLLGADPDGDPLAFRLLSNPTNGKLYLYDEDALDHQGVRVQRGDPAVPAEAGTDSLRLCYETNNRFFFGSDSFRYISIDSYGAESPALPGPPSKSYIQINVFET